MIPWMGLVFGLPLLFALWMSGQWKSRRAWRLTLVASVILALYFYVLYHTQAQSAFFIQLEWNWLGKVASISLLCLIYLFLPQHMKNDVGLWRHAHPPEWRSTILVSCATLLFFVICSALIAMVTSQQCSKLSLETLLFKATLPGIDEELLFRGVLLAILTSAFGKPWKILGISIGWGAVPIIIIFGLAHGFEIAAASAPMATAIIISLITGIMGILLLWIKERTGSLWIAIIIHNLANILSYWVCT